jgi:hypothetical protein
MDFRMHGATVKIKKIRIYSFVVLLLVFNKNAHVFLAPVTCN